LTTPTTPTELLRQAREALAYLLPLAEMQPADVERGRHLMQGDCPDETQPSSRDAECPACKKMVAAAELIAAIDALPSAPAWPCHCDERGIGKPGVTCGDCPRDYGHTVDSAPSGEPAEFDHDIGADRFKVVKGPFWWHIRIGDSTGNVGKFHSKLAAEDVALKMLTAFRDGAYMQYHAMRAAPQAAPAPQAEPVWCKHHNGQFCGKPGPCLFPHCKPAHPAPAVAATVRGLTDAEIDDDLWAGDDLMGASS